MEKVLKIKIWYLFLTFIVANKGYGQMIYPHVIEQYVSNQGMADHKFVGEIVSPSSTAAPANYVTIEHRQVALPNLPAGQYLLKTTSSTAQPLLIRIIKTH